MRSKWAHPELPISGVFDIDGARLQVVAKHYGLRAYNSYAELLQDPDVQIVVNLTTIGSHVDVTQQALAAGKHVYSEKPLTRDLATTQQLFSMAASNGVVLSGAPCNIFSDSIGTVWKAVLDGAIGTPVLVYAELDDNPAHLMQLERVRSPTGAPFPFVEELQEGCTVEHVAYHLVWLCAMFGPVLSLTASSSWLIKHKTSATLDPADTPDVSVAYLKFANGVVARVTCSWVAPRDHSFRVIGDQGEITLDNIFHDQSPVRLERFSRTSLSIRKSYSARTYGALGRRFGLGGHRLALVRRWKSHAVEAERDVGSSVKHRLVSWLRRREVYAQDKFLGIAEMARALDEGRPQPLPADFLMHLNELTLLIDHNPRMNEGSISPTTTFEDFRQPPEHLAPVPNYRSSYRQRTLERAATSLIDLLHRG